MSWIFRKVEKSDSEKIFQWRNSVEVYRYLFNASPVSANVHELWLDGVLQNPQILFLMAEYKGSQVGTLRFDLSPDMRTAEVGIYLAPEFQGKRLGAEMLLFGELECRKRFATLTKIIAKVLIENAASEKMFVKSGYQKHFIQLEKKLEN